MPEQQPLIVVVADRSMKATVDAIIARPLAIGMQDLGNQVESRVMENYDANVVRNSPAYLRPSMNLYRFALVMCDRFGSGRDDETREVIEEDIEVRLAGNGWAGRSAAIVIDPELDVWVWQNSHHVTKALGWHAQQPALYDWLHREGYMMKRGDAKPRDPKDALNKALRLARIPKSSSVFEEVASSH